MIVYQFSKASCMEGAERLLQAAYKAKDGRLEIINAGEVGERVLACGRADRCLELRARSRTLWLMDEALKSELAKGSLPGVAKTGSTFKFASRLEKGVLQALGVDKTFSPIWLDIATEVEGHPAHRYKLVSKGISHLQGDSRRIANVFDMVLAAADSQAQGKRPFR